MVINIGINKIFSIHDSVQKYPCHNALNKQTNKQKINNFDVLIFIQMRTDENKFWQIRNTSGNGCVQVRRDFNK